MFVWVKWNFTENKSRSCNSLSVCLTNSLSFVLSKVCSPSTSGLWCNRRAQCWLWPSALVVNLPPSSGKGGANGERERKRELHAAAQQLSLVVVIIFFFLYQAQHLANICPFQLARRVSRFPCSLHRLPFGRHSANSFAFAAGQQSTGSSSSSNQSALRSTS